MIIVVSKWCHNVTGKSGCFLAPERGDFLKSSGILQLMKMELTDPKSSDYMVRFSHFLCGEKAIGNGFN